MFTVLLVTLFQANATFADFMQIQRMSVFMVRFISLYIFGDAVLIILSGALRGVGDTVWTMVVSVAIYWSFAFAALLLLKVAMPVPG